MVNHQFCLREQASLRGISASCAKIPKRTITTMWKVFSFDSRYSHVSIYKNYRNNPFSSLLQPIYIDERRGNEKVVITKFQHLGAFLENMVGQSLAAAAELKEPAQLSFQFMGTKWDGVLNNCAIADMDAIGKEAQLRGFEFVRSITLVAEPFTMENDGLNSFSSRVAWVWALQPLWDYSAWIKKVRKINTRGYFRKVADVWGFFGIWQLPSVSSIWLLMEEGLTGVLNRGHFGPDSNKKTGQHKDVNIWGRTGSKKWMSGYPHCHFPTLQDLDGHRRRRSSAPFL
ncbi:hypothetical protein LXL04_029436 [Taraxacum kok-saghyz]